VSDVDVNDKVLRVRERVQQWLAEEFGGITIGMPGTNDFEMRIDSTFVRVVVRSFRDHAIIEITAPILFDVPITSEFKDYVALNTGLWVLGGFHYFEDEGGANLIFQHTILGDYVDKEELLASLMAVGATAEQLDDELLGQFGGRRSLDD